MGDSRKQNVSVRLSNSDLSKIKSIAKRLGTTESDLFRFAVRTVVAKLTPLHDNEVVGRDLVPVFIENGGELTTHFDLDARKLDRIINAGELDPEKRVDKRDLELLAMSGMHEHHLFMQLKQVVAIEHEGLPPAKLLRTYLLGKYMARQQPMGDRVLDVDQHHSDGVFTTAI